MKKDKKEIFEIARKLLKESTIGFRNFLKRDEFAPMRENPYIMGRSDEDLASFVLFDFQDFYPNSDRVLRSLLESQGLDEFTIERMKKILRDSYVSLFNIEKKDDHYLFYDCILDEYIEVELAEYLNTLLLIPNFCNQVNLVGLLLYLSSSLRITSEESLSPALPAFAL